MINKKEIPELICLVASIGFIVLGIPTSLLWSKDPTIVSMPVYFGLFMFLLCLCLTLLRKHEALRERVKILEQRFPNEVKQE